MLAQERLSYAHLHIIYYVHDCMLQASICANNCSPSVIFTVAVYLSTCLPKYIRRFGCMLQALIYSQPCSTAPLFLPL